MRGTPLASMFKIAGIAFMVFALALVIWGPPQAAVTFFGLGAIWFGLALWGARMSDRAEAERAADRHLFATGVPAVAVVESVKPSTAYVNHMPVVRMTFRITPATGEPFSHTEKIVMPAMSIPPPGHLVNARVDPAQPGRVAFDIDTDFDGAPGVVLRTRRPEPEGD